MPLFAAILLVGFFLTWFCFSGDFLFLVFLRDLFGIIFLFFWGFSSKSKLKFMLFIVFGIFLFWCFAEIYGLHSFFCDKGGGLCCSSFRPQASYHSESLELRPLHVG